MPKDLRSLLSLALASALFSGCNYAPRWQLRQSQLQAFRVYNANQQLTAQLGEAEGMTAQLSMENQQLQQGLQIANERLANLASEREKLHDEYKHLLTTLPAPDNPLGGGANKRFEELSRKYPEFEFDPVTGVSRFNGDLLFATGSDQIQAAGMKVLQEFASIMNSGDARQFNILIVGHTDDQNIVHATTRARHPTNWDLSAHRATAVVKALSSLGLTEPRMGIAGYSKYQPAVPNSDDGSRQQNRRVEIFILAPDAAVAGRESGARR